MAESLTRDAREILERAAELAAARRAQAVTPTDILRATLQFPRSLADKELRALGVDPASVLSHLPAGGADGEITSRRVVANADREATVLGHHQVDSIHLLLAMLYSDSPATAAALQKAGVSLYDLRAHLQTGSKAAVPDYSRPSRPDRSLRRRPWPSLRGVVSVSPFFLSVAGVFGLSGGLLWFDALPRATALLTAAFVLAGWIASVCIHEFGHAFVAYLGGDRSVVGAGYLTLNPLRYHNVVMSLILPVVFLLLGGVALPGGAVYINHSALRTRAWSSAVSIAGPTGNVLCGALIAAVFWFAKSSITIATADFFGALALLGFYQVLAVVLNLVPVPGLDGFGLIRPWLPDTMQMWAIRYGGFGIYAVFIALWFVAPLRQAFYDVVLQLTTIANIPPFLIAIGELNMRFF